MDIALETADFIDYLHGIANRELGHPVGDATAFDGKIIRCRIVFIARPEVYEVKGPGPYRQAVEWAISHAYRHVYLLGTQRNLGYVREVAAAFAKDRRITSHEETVVPMTTSTGRRITQIVVQLSVDVRLRTGVGREPFLVVGAEGEARLRRQLKAGGARVN